MINVKKLVRSVCFALIAAVAVSSVAGCSADVDSISDPTVSETSAPAPSEEKDDLNLSSTLVSGGGSSAGLVCTLCKAQGCECGAGGCINCGYKTR